jgi:hypothetical protein
MSRSRGGWPAFFKSFDDRHQSAEMRTPERDPRRELSQLAARLEQEETAKTEAQDAQQTTDEEDDRD